MLAVYVDIAALQQLLAVQAAATPKPSVASSITSSVTPDMQSWSLERLGESKYVLEIMENVEKSSHAHAPFDLALF